MSNTVTHLEAELVILASPNQETGVVSAKFKEELSVNGEEAPSVRGRGVRLGKMGVALTFLLRHLDLFIQETPLENATEQLPTCVSE